MVLVDQSGKENDHVVSIPEKVLEKEKEISSPLLPVQIKVLQYYANSDVQRKTDAHSGPATHGFGTNLDLRAQGLVSDPDRRNLPSAIVELLASGKSLGTFVVADSFFDKEKGKAFVLDLQDVDINGKKWGIGMRPTRYYLPFSLELEKFSHDRYAGTDIPMNFSSKVKIRNPGRNENRDVLIYMNSPLRYGGQTFYQGGFSPDNDSRKKKISILQVVRNPGWLAPYFACSCVGLGLVIQFMTHLVQFIGKRKKA
ncbi:MAG: hypothetical protein JWN25_2417 [Verrucomicrobiales bacterium]|nr:hypothetical protein [Verrucomicrobiales bacterium]